MRFIRNEIQTPKTLVPPEKRKSLPFIILAIGVCILIVGVAAFFSAFLYRDLIQNRWGVTFRSVQTKSIYIAAIGVIFYIVGALILKVPIRKTTYYKVTTIMKNEPFDPARKGDYTKAIYARLHNLSDEWAYFSEVKPPDCDFVIPQVIVGPGGVYATQPISDNPEQKSFQDPGPEFHKAGQKLGNALGQQVLPIVIFSHPKLVSLYHTYCKPKTRVMNIREIFEFFSSRKDKLSEKMQADIEAKVYAMIAGTPPGA